MPVALGNMKPEGSFCANRKGPSAEFPQRAPVDDSISDYSSIVSPVGLTMYW